MRRGARFAEKLANGGGGEAATLPSRCEVWIGDDRVARQPKRFGKYVPGFGYIAAARPPERRRIVDRGVEQLQIVGHEVDERSRHYRRSIASRPAKRKCSPFGTISAAASPRAPRARRTGGASARSVSAAAACDGEEAVRQNHNGEVAAAVHSAVASEPKHGQARSGRATDEGVLSHARTITSHAGPCSPAPTSPKESCEPPRNNCACRGRAMARQRPVREATGAPSSSSATGT